MKYLVHSVILAAALALTAGVANAQNMPIAVVGPITGSNAALGEQMNDPNFYLARSDAKELIANYEQLGREIERLYEELMGLDGAAPSNS